MTEEQLREIEAREAAATPGPWRRGVGNTAMRVCSAYPAKSYFICEGTNADDLEFAAHSREDIPELVAEVRRLREGLARLERGDAIWGVCAVCEYDVPRGGHQPGCPLAAILAGESQLGGPKTLVR